jgi:hypothetical protein
MIPPVMDSRGHLVFKFPDRGVTHLHHDGHAEFFISTRPYKGVIEAYYWKVGSEWSENPKAVRLSKPEGNLSPIHVSEHE